MMGLLMSGAAAVAKSALDIGDPLIPRAFPKVGILSKPLIWETGLWRVTSKAKGNAPETQGEVFTETYCRKAKDWRRESLFCAQEGCKSKLVVRWAGVPPKEQAGAYSTFWDGEVRSETEVWLVLDPATQGGAAPQGLNLRHYVETYLSRDTQPTRARPNREPLSVVESQVEYQWLGWCPVGQKYE